MMSKKNEQVQNRQGTPAQPHTEDQVDMTSLRNVVPILIGGLLDEECKAKAMGIGDAKPPMPKDPFLALAMLRLSETCRTYRSSSGALKEALHRWCWSFCGPFVQRRWCWDRLSDNVSSGGGPANIVNPVYDLLMRGREPVHIVNPRYEPIDFCNKFRGRVWCSTVKELMKDYVVEMVCKYRLPEIWCRYIDDDDENDDEDDDDEESEERSEARAYFQNRVYEVDNVMRVDIEDLPTNIISAEDEIHAAMKKGTRIGPVIFVYLPSTLSHPKDPAHGDLSEHAQVGLSAAID